MDSMENPVGICARLGGILAAAYHNVAALAIGDDHVDRGVVLWSWWNWYLDHDRQPDSMTGRARNESGLCRGRK